MSRGTSAEGKLRVLLAGLGVRGRYWADVISRSSRSEIAAYADPNPAARERFNAQFGARPSFDTPEEAIAAMPDLGALVLANPPLGRDSIVRACCARRLPMLIEKPLALDILSASRLVDMAETANVPLMVGLNFRYLAVTQAVMRLLAEGTVGRASFARFTYERWRDGNRPDLNKYPLTMDQPMLWEQSIHHFDLLRYVYAARPITVQARTWNPPWSMYRDAANVAALFTFDSGIKSGNNGGNNTGMVVNYQGTWQANWAEPHFEWRTECTEGIITQRHQFGELSYARRADATLTSVGLPPHELWVTETLGLWEAFLATALDGAPLQCSGLDHLVSLAMVAACALSGERGETVTLDEVLTEAGH
jgi:predicted dehydrogenase